MDQEKFVRLLGIGLAVLVCTACANPQSVELARAVETGQVAQTEALLRSGSSPNARASDGEELLAYAIKNRKYDVAEVLLRNGANRRITFEYLDVVVVLAADHKGCPANLLSSFLAAGADPNASFSHISALGYATFAGQADCAKVLIHAGADVRAATPAHITALHDAAGNGMVSVVQSLLAAGATIDARTEQGGWTPLMMAANSDSTDADETIDLLIAHGADPCLTDSSGRKPADIARRHEHELRAQALESACKKQSEARSSR
jgi:ankyrin repeat protein